MLESLHPRWMSLYRRHEAETLSLYIYTTIDFQKEHMQSLLTSFKVDMNNSATCLHRTPVFEWY
jgi:hypothetical protein